MLPGLPAPHPLFGSPSSADVVSCRSTAVSKPTTKKLANAWRRWDTESRYTAGHISLRREKSTMECGWCVCPQSAPNILRRCCIPSLAPSTCLLTLVMWFTTTRWDRHYFRLFHALRGRKPSSPCRCWIGRVGSRDKSPLRFCGSENGQQQVFLTARWSSHALCKN